MTSAEVEEKLKIEKNRKKNEEMEGNRYSEMININNG